MYQTFTLTIKIVYTWPMCAEIFVCVIYVHVCMCCGSMCADDIYVCIIYVNVCAVDRCVRINMCALYMHMYVLWADVCIYIYIYIWIHVFVCGFRPRTSRNRNLRKKRAKITS